MTLWSRLAHMLCGLFQLMDGSATFLVTCQPAVFTAVAVPGFVLWAVSSNSVSIQTSPTPLTVGRVATGSVTGWLKCWRRKALRSGMRTGRPRWSKASTETAGETGSQVDGFLLLYTCQLDGLVMTKKARTSLTARSEAVGMIVGLIAKGLSVNVLPRLSTGVVRGSWTITAPSMNGCT